MQTTNLRIGRTVCGLPAKCECGLYAQDLRLNHFYIQESGFIEIELLCPVCKTEYEAFLEFDQFSILQEK